MSVVTELDVRDIRFATSRELDGSDAVNADPDAQTEPGTGACILPQSLADHASPGGLVWQEAA